MLFFFFLPSFLPSSQQRRQWARREEIFRQQRRRRGGRGELPHGRPISARSGNLPLRRQIHDGGGEGITMEVMRRSQRSRGWKLSPVSDGFWPDLDNRRPHLVEFLRPTVEGSRFFARRRGLALSATAAEVAVLAVVARTLAGLRRGGETEGRGEIRELVLDWWVARRRGGDER